jgi:hypothetical protein
MDTSETGHVGSDRVGGANGTMHAAELIAMHQATEIIATEIVGEMCEWN